MTPCQKQVTQEGTDEVELTRGATIIPQPPSLHLVFWGKIVAYY